MTETLYKRNEFGIGGEEPFFPGFTAGDYWNGWDCPSFSKAVAERLLQSMDMTFHFDADQDAFVVTEDSEEQGVDTYKGYDIVTENGVKAHVYSIGAYAWIWYAKDRE